MKILKLTLAMFAFLFLGCSKDEAIKSDCIKSFLDKSNMIEYNGQKIGCKSFYVLYHYQNKQFFLLGNHCMDMISYPVDCEGNYLCKNRENFRCKNFYACAEKIGIIGIDE